MLRVVGVPLLENKQVSWFLGFLVLGFLVSISFGFVGSWFQRLLASLFQIVKDSMVPYYQNAHLVFAGRY